MAVILDGKKLADKFLESLRLKADDFYKKHNIKPKLATILIGDDSASQVYIKSKTKKCEVIGVDAENLFFNKNTDEKIIIDAIEKLNKDKDVHGILLQQPIAPKYNQLKILSLISPHKDVDGFHPINLGNLLYNNSIFTPCTPLGIMKLMEEYKIEPEGKNAVVLGRSNIVGKPAALLLLNKNATVTICHSKTKNLKQIIGNADILISAMGVPHFVTSDMIKKGCCVIDVGINELGGKITGDVDFENVAQKAAYITPVPGGVGPLTIAMLLHNTILAAEMSVK